MCEANSLSNRIWYNVFQSLCKTWTVIVVMGPWVMTKGGLCILLLFDLW